MAQITITEALAEVKTLAKRIESKRQFVGQYLWRQEQIKDPLEKEGGSRSALAAERQAINDLLTRLVRVRAAIAHANATTTLTIGATTRTVADWLTWRRECADGAGNFLKAMRDRIQAMRVEAHKKSVNVRGDASGATDPTDVIVNVDELALAKEIEAHEEVLGVLDGKLSLLNATTFVEL